MHVITTVADLRGREGRTPPPLARNFFIFMPNNRLVPPVWGWRPLLWEIMDPPLLRRHLAMLLPQEFHYFSVCKDWRQEVEKIKSCQRKISCMMYDSGKGRKHDDYSHILELSKRIQVQ